MKKKITIATILVLTLCLSVISVSAVTQFGEFNCWYSDSHQILYLPSTISYYFAPVNSSNMDETKKVEYVNHAINAWNQIASFNYVSSTDPDVYNLRFLDITRDDATAKYIPLNSPAFVQYDNKTLEGTGTYNLSTKYVYSANKVSMYFVWDGDMSYYNTTLYSDAKWKSISTHEYGHAIGFGGHNINGNSTNKTIMDPYINNYFDTWGIDSPQPNDISHMDNLY